MSDKPIFCCTHPRACSTAFERVFMTRRDTLQCIHEPFGDAFYYGPERLSTRFEEDKEAREQSGFQDSTYKTIFDRIERESSEGKRLFIKDIIHYLVPPKEQVPMIAPSLAPKRRGVGTVNGPETLVNGHSGKPNMFPWDTEKEEDNPTVVPKSLLQSFHWIFLIRDPHRSIPSYYRCTIPPLDSKTGFHHFDSSEAGYVEVRLVFDYLRKIGSVGTHVANGIANGHVTNGVANGHVTNGVANGHVTNGVANGHVTNGIANGHGTNGTLVDENLGRSNTAAEMCVIDADDMLDYPAKYIEAVCNSVGIPYTPDMLNWDNEVDQRAAREAFKKWYGFHEDAIESTCLLAREHKICSKPAKAEEEWDKEWREKYGAKAAKVIRETVNACMDDYLYMKQFALKL